MSASELTQVLQDFQPPSLPVSLVYSPNRYMSAQLRAFAVPRLRARFTQ